jgi:murein DD-endopeptidase MepM/ murein hydrolase activator NlpD
MAVNTNYNTTYAAATLTIAPSTQVLNFESKTVVFDNKEHSLAPAATNATGDMVIKYSTDGKNFNLDVLPVYTNAGVYTVIAKAVSKNYLITEVMAILTISAAKQTVTFNNKTVNFDNKKHSLNPAKSNASGDTKITYTTDGSNYSSTIPTFRNAGSYKITARAVSINYWAKEKIATLTIRNKKSKIIGNITGIPKGKIFKYKTSKRKNRIKVSLPAKNPEIIWKVSPKSCATIVKTGPNTAVVNFKNKEGRVTIRARLKKTPSIYKETHIKLVRNITNIRTALKKYYISKKKSLTIPVVLYDNTSKLWKGGVKSKLTWKSSNPKLLKVNRKGKIKASKKIKKKQKVILTVTAASGVRKRISVIVVPKAKKLKKIKFKFTKVSANNKIKQISIKIYPPDATNLKVKFKSSKPSKLRIDKSGRMIIKKKGKYKITIKVGKKRKKSRYPLINFIHPFPDYEYMSSNYGPRAGGFHQGIDFAGPYGAKIRASASGKVIFTGYKGSYGNCVFIRHSNKIVSIYAHLSKISVRKGSHVKQYKKIGECGNTGYSTGNHLHYEIRKNNNAINPKGYY